MPKLYHVIPASVVNRLFLNMYDILNEHSEWSNYLHKI